MAYPYRVELTEAQRAHLRGLIGSGIAPARMLTRARMLLNANHGEGGPGWADTAIAAALDVRTSTVLRVRRQFVVEGLAAGMAGDRGFEISIDTVKSAVAEAALDAGAGIVNDVTAFRSAPELAGLVAQRRAGCCLMHMLGEPRTMQKDPRYGDVVSEVKSFLEERLAFAVSEGVDEGLVWLDPGIGFGKTVEHNLELLRRLDELVAIGRPIVVGTSRKSFLGKLAGGRSESERLPGTIATNVLALERGASVFRVHDVAQVADALAVAAATVGDPREELA